jgi:hypothetical protein
MKLSCLSGKLLLVFASTVFLDSESCGTHDHILPSHDSGSRATLHDLPVNILLITGFIPRIEERTTKQIILSTTPSIFERRGWYAEAELLVLWM